MNSCGIDLGYLQGFYLLALKGNISISCVDKEDIYTEHFLVDGIV